MIRGYGARVDPDAWGCADRVRVGEADRPAQLDDAPERLAGWTRWWPATAVAGDESYILKVRVGGPGEWRCCSSRSARWRGCRRARRSCCPRRTRTGRPRLGFAQLTCWARPSSTWSGRVAAATSRTPAEARSTWRRLGRSGSRCRSRRGCPATRSAGCSGSTVLGEWTRGTWCRRRSEHAGGRDAGRGGRGGVRLLDPGHRAGSGPRPSWPGSSTTTRSRCTPGRRAGAGAGAARILDCCGRSGTRAARRSVRTQRADGAHGPVAEGRAAVERVVALADVVKVSSEDLEWLYPGDDRSPPAAAGPPAGPSLVVVTLGGDGAVALTADGRSAAPRRRDRRGHRRGRDAFTAGLLAALADRDALAPGGPAGVDLAEVSTARAWSPPSPARGPRRPAHPRRTPVRAPVRRAR